MSNVYTNDAHEFWGNRAWPDDDPVRGFTFLARAMLDIGMTLFPDEWSGAEPFLSLAPRPLPPLPLSPLRLPSPPVPTPSARPEDAVAAPDGPWWRSEYFGGVVPQPQTIERDPEAERLTAAARVRWDEVMRATVWFLNSGNLSASWRGLFGGGFYNIPDTDWNTEAPIAQRRFLLCRMHPHQPFTGPEDGPVFIYVSTASLTALLSTLNSLRQSKLAEEASSSAPALPAEEPPAGPRYDEFRAALLARMQDDPDRVKPENRHLNKAGVRKWAKQAFGIGSDQTDAERSVIMRSAKFAHRWDKSGRPKKIVGK